MLVSLKTPAFSAATAPSSGITLPSISLCAESSLRLVLGHAGGLAGCRIGEAGWSSGEGWCSVGSQVLEAELVENPKGRAPFAGIFAFLGAS